MENALKQVAWETCLFEPRPDRELEAYARRKMGMPHPSIRYFAPVPWVARAMLDLHPEHGLLMHVEQQVADLVALVVSQENSCRFCYAAVRVMLWGQGMSPERIQRIEQDLSRADLPAQTVAAMMFGRSQSRTGPAGAREARQALLGAGFGNDELKEIAYAAGHTDFSNRAFTIPAIPPFPMEKMPEQLHMRLLRPLLGRILKSHSFRGQATPLDSVPSYPYGRLVAAFAGSPIAPVLGRTIEDMWASTHLTRRCKLLMFAIIARGLSYELFAQELSEALQAEGLSEATQARVLTHLDAPELDPIERLLVPFARETIWFEPAPLQRRARMLRDALSGPQLVEAIGVLALANGLNRMSAMVLDQ